MKKQFYSFLGLALSLFAWGGARSAAVAQVQWQEVSDCCFNFDDNTTYPADYIPAGWTLNIAGTERASGTTHGSDSRLIAFPNTTIFNKALYIKQAGTDDVTYAIYGNLDGHKLAIPAGYVDIRVPAFVWGGTSGKIKLEVLEYDATKTSLSDWAVIGTITPSIKASAPKGTDSDGAEIAVQNTTVSAVDTLSFKFFNATARNIVVKLTTTGQWNQVGVTGLSVLCDEDVVWTETFSGVTPECAPAESSGWQLYEEGTQITPVDPTTKTGTRVRNLGSSVLPCGLVRVVYGYKATTYDIYGNVSGKPLQLEAGNYQIFFHAANWEPNKTASVYLSLLDANDNEVATLEQAIPAAAHAQGSTSTDFTPALIKLDAVVSTAGKYKLKFNSNERMVYGNIFIRKDLTTVLNETFSGLNGVVPATGWIVYNNGEARPQGSTQSGGARAFAISGFDAISNVAYMGWQGSCYMTYGEANCGRTLTLEAGQEYRLTYYAANWTGKTDYSCTMKCEIIGNSGEGTVLTRTDVLMGRCNNGADNIKKFVTNPDFIQTTFKVTQSGNYTLKFTSTNSVISNISLQRNTDNIAYTTSLDKFGFTTLYLDQAVALPEGVKAYTGAFNSTYDVLKLTELSGNVIPANTGVILQGEAGTALTFYPTTEAATTVSGNALLGTSVGIKSPSDKDIYVLGYKTSDETSSFYKHSTSKITGTVTTTIDTENAKATIVTKTTTTTGSSSTSSEVTKEETYTPATEATTNSDGSTTAAKAASHTEGTTNINQEYVRVIPANKAYLSLSVDVITANTQANASAIRIQFGEDETDPEVGNVTAIEQIEVETAPAARVIYDLSGRRLTDMARPGLYIVNGKKMVVR